MARFAFRGGDNRLAAAYNEMARFPRLPHGSFSGCLAAAGTAAILSGRRTGGR
jgi:hypothetical protein